MKSHHWKAAHAKAHFSQVLRDAQQQPQVIENRGQVVAVVLSIHEYLALRECREQSEPVQRWADFLSDSEQLRTESGPELVCPARLDRAFPGLQA